VQGFTRRDPYFEVKIAEVTEQEGAAQGLEAEALVRSVKEQVQKGVNLGKGVSPDVVVIINNLEHPGRLADLVASNLDLKVEQAQQILEIFDPLERLTRLAELLGKEIEVLEMHTRSNPGARGDGQDAPGVLSPGAAQGHPERIGRDGRARAGGPGAGTKDRQGQDAEAVEQEAKTQLSRLSRMHPTRPRRRSFAPTLTG
jgi:ATP-dependent Lon protease